MAIKQSTAFSLSVARGKKIVVYGRGGVGKTILGLTMPGRIAYATVDAGMLSTSKKNQERLFGVGNAKDVEVFELETLADIEEFHGWCMDPEFPFDSAVLDSATAVAEKALAVGLETAKDPRQAYGTLFSQIVDMFWKFRDIERMNVLFTCEEAPNREGCTPLHIPSMPGAKLGAKVPYLFDELFHLDVATTTEGLSYRFLQTQPSVQFDAKDRSGALDPIEEPNLSNVIAKIIS